MTQRYRDEADTLARLAESDAGLIDRAELLRAAIEPLSGEAMIAALPAIDARVADVADRLAARGFLLG